MVETLPKTELPETVSDEKAIETGLDSFNPLSALSKGELRRQKRREYMREYAKKYRQRNREKIREYLKEYYQKNKEKYREYYKKYRERICSRWRKRYHSDPEYRRKQLSNHKRLWKKRQEAYKRFKIEFGGKCSICGENDLDMLIPHHPDGKEEKRVQFIKS